MEYAHASHAEPPISPPEPEPQATKKIKVYVRLSGLIEEEIEVPADLDITDIEAVADAMEKNTPYPGGFWNLGLGEFWDQKSLNDTIAPWYDRDRAMVAIESVEG
ncbi:MAG: hypothetical protein WC593_15635 [Methanoregula sp.]